MRISLLRGTIDEANRQLIEFASMPSNFVAAFDYIAPEERLAIISDLAQLSRLSSTLIELVGDYYKGGD